MTRRVRVGINGYGVISKRVADAVKLQEDMELVGVADVVYDYASRRARALRFRCWGRLNGRDVLGCCYRSARHREHLLRDGSVRMQSLRVMPLRGVWRQFSRSFELCRNPIRSHSVSNDPWPLA